MRSDWKNYLKSLNNYNDLFQYFGTLWIALTNVTGLNEPDLIEQRSLCTFLFLSQGFKVVLDWLGLFDNTSFFITLITKTIRDIGYIGLIIFVILVYTGCAMYMLQQNSTNSGDIIYPIFQNFLLDSFLNQYLLILGEFHIDGF